MHINGSNRLLLSNIKQLHKQNSNLNFNFEYTEYLKTKKKDQYLHGKCDREKKDHSKYTHNS